VKLNKEKSKKEQAKYRKKESLKKRVRSMIVQWGGFFGTKKPIHCTIIDSVLFSVAFIFETAPNTLVTIRILNSTITDRPITYKYGKASSENPALNRWIDTCRL